jgi:predicted dehydrogenase/threonine dehydrogenase-like Zn-dependent dehydrogenase
MLQVIQPIDGRATEVAEVPAPVCGPYQVLISNACSLISAGTEKGVVELAGKSLLAKARQRPDHVRRVLQKVRQEGLSSTLQQVRAKLGQPMPLGYSSAGTVIEVGPGVEAFRPGDRVASNGPHAGAVAVGQNLVARVPDGLAMDRACYAVVGAVALQGVRLGGVGLGSVACVIGLGLIGQITVALLKAAGCTVLGTDLDPARCVLGRSMGADWAETSGLADAASARTRDHGADAVFITASTPSNAPLELAAKVARAKGKVVSVGATGLEVPRREFYPKELELVVSCSYGPGRYDPSYEEAGLDYPYAHVRWTEQRNIQAALDLMAAGRLDVGPLTTHRFPIERATEAYALIREGSAPAVGVVLTYPEPEAAPARRADVSRLAGVAAPAAGDGKLGVGFIGAGSFASAVLLPALAARNDVTPVGVCSAGGLSARTQASRNGFHFACTDRSELLADSDVHAVFVATRHDLHAPLLLEALRAGKHVFVEKPLALTTEELDEIEEVAATDGGPVWSVGFNRRFSAAARAVREHFARVEGPVTAVYRFNAGDIPPEHWTQDEAVGGGRIVGEACHAADLLTFLLGSPPVRVFAESVSAGQALRVAGDRCAVTMRHANGSVSTLLYAAGGDRAAPKERVELFGSGRVAVIDDFHRVELFHGGRRTVRSFRGQSKGHREGVDAFLAAARACGPPPIPYSELLATSRAMIAAVASARTGGPVDLAPNHPERHAPNATPEEAPSVS